MSNGKFWWCVGLMLGMSVSVGCGSDEVEQKCRVELVRESAQPGELVGVVSTWGDLGPLVEVKVEGHDAYHTFLRLNENMTHSLLAPVHIEGIEGGAVELTFHTEKHTCEPVGFNVMAMDPAPGTLGRVTQKTNRLIDLQIESLGYTREELVALIEGDVPGDKEIIGHLIPLYVGYFMFDSPANSNSVQKVLSGEAEDFAALEASGVNSGEFVEAMLGRSNFEQMLDEQIERLEAAPAFAPGWEAFGPGEVEAGAPHPLVVKSDDLLKVEIDTPEQLSEMMRVATGHCGVLDTSGTNRFQDLRTLIALVPTTKNPYAEGGKVALSAFGLLLNEFARIQCGLLPTKMEFRHDPAALDFKEDQECDGLNKLSAYATASGWSMSESFRQLMLEGLSVALGARKGLKINDKHIPIFGGKVDGKWVYDTNILEKAISGTWTGTRRLLNNVLDFIAVKGADISTGESDLLEVHPTPWNVPFENFDMLRAEDYEHVVRPCDTAGLRSQCGGLCVKPSAVGAGTLNIYAAPSDFPPEGATASVPAVVHPIEIDVPTQKLVLPGDSFGYSYAVKNAVDPALEWTSEAIAGLPPTVEASGPFVAYAPVDDGLYPVVVTAESTSTTGLRAPEYDPPPRRGYTILVHKALDISPKSRRCVKPGETVTFTADTPVEDAVFTWSPGAYMSPTSGKTAVFTAPATTGDYEVQVTAKYGSGAQAVTVTETAQVHVDDCRCWWQLEIPGLAYLSGDMAMRGPPKFVEGELSWHLTLTDQNQDRGGIFINAPGVPSTEYTRSDVMVMWQLRDPALSAIGVNYSGEDPTTVRITKFDGGYAYGHAAGMMHVTTLGQAPVPVPYALSFRSAGLDEEAAKEYARLTQESGGKLSAEALLLTIARSSSCVDEEK